MSVQNEAKEKQKDRKKYAPRKPFPEHTLQQALELAKAIQDKNAGKAWKPVFVADALEIKVSSSNFRDLTSSAFKYGLTQGTWSAPFISLSPLGQAITKPTDGKQEMEDKQNAVLKIEVFKNVYEHYRDAKFPSPDDKYFKNMLETEFKVPRELIDECINLLIENGKFTHILYDSQGALHVVFAEGETGQVPPPGVTEAPEEEVGEKPPAEFGVPPTPTPTPAVNQMFVIHGKNTAPLEQLKGILTEFKVPYKVAIDEPHVGRPISQKVADLMKACTSAIVIFTADEEYTDANGNKSYKPSDNVVYELGAASYLYQKKIVILKEEGVSLASDFSDLGYITFEKDEIKAKAMDIIKELIGFGLLKVTPA